MPSQWTRKNDDGDKCITAIPWRPVNPDRAVIGYEYEMPVYFEALVNRYCDIGGIERTSLRYAQTPFINEANDPSGVVASSGGSEPAAAWAIPEMGGDDDSTPAVANQPSKADRTRAQRKATRTAELAATKQKP
jgi:hypothetical protein